MPAPALRPDWTVLLIGGNSGAGKTQAAQAIARQTGISAIQVDDIRLALQRLTTPAQQPALHFFLTTPDLWRHPPASLRDRLVAVAEAVSAALEIVIANHLAHADPVVLEGDGLLPALAAQPGFAGVIAAGRVRAVFLVEPETSVLQANMQQRQRGFGLRGAGEQTAQVEMARLYGAWLQQAAAQRGLPVLAPRPWATLRGRILAAAAPPPRD